MQIKKLLIIVPTFDSGGTSTSLMNLVSLIDKEKYDVSVYAINNEGSTRNFVVKHAHLIGYSTSKESGSVSLVRRLYRGLFGFVKSSKKFIKKCGVDISPFLFRLVAKKLDKGNYDFVISFQEGHATLLASYFKHGKKIAWVRSEYKRYLEKANKKPEKNIYAKFDKIINVSKAASANFLSCLPMFKDCAHVIYNIINSDRILSMSQEKVEDIPSGQTFTIISVGRIDPVKRFSQIPLIAQELDSAGISFKWLIIGGVAVKEENELLLGNIGFYHQEKNVICMGKRANPYPYILKSDLLVCLSSSETFNNTLTEAKILGVPVVTTNFPAASESIDNDVEGWVEPIEKISARLISVLTNKECLSRVRRNLSSYKHDNNSNFNTLYKDILNG